MPHGPENVDHPNVVRTLEFASVGEHDLLVMEYAEGRTLRELAARDEEFLRDVARQAAEGLAAIHAAGIVHRDLKPENILVTRDGVVRIMDLGVAKAGDASVALTHTGQFLGSLQYAAPEQCAGRAIGPMADLYALGVVLYELAAGENPFRAQTPGASFRAQLDLVPPPLALVSPFLAAVVATLLEKDPERRFPSARVLATALAKGERGAWWLARRLRR
jgi:serine/threonine-protein kinase